MECIIKLQHGKYNRDLALWSFKPSTDRCRHWLNPLFIKCRNIPSI
ncbi:hypothetical protein Bccel_4069 [Pseudobacteroides cellulosolvens ATCC 35603 = DSM 2933]|uniref:Uncharacterized protein n=1 Tax=Pseudobacteroides cellulosolvens ATCC 35603 = DSM 2933 TaxID=398512 RepID=A0A0L6JSX8_9FIRM|nr:hypothetical protein Bccel_4069 [Pseudobacteroides cellulosolvens ATCC 35603 = DSM 2933]